MSASLQEPSCKYVCTDFVFSHFQASSFNSVSQVAQSPAKYTHTPTSPEPPDALPLKHEGMKHENPSPDEDLAPDEHPSVSHPFYFTSTYLGTWFYV